jgi:hypothetical protein
MSDQHEHRERDLDAADDNDPDEEYANTGEPWAKTSSGDKEHVTDDDG